jgi:hypothetical protein
MDGAERLQGTTAGIALIATHNAVAMARLPLLERKGIASRDGQPASEVQPTEKPDPSQATSPNPQQAELSEAEQKKVRELQERDRKVRAHERAHLMAAGDLARGGANFIYQCGPDGKRYAVGGEVHLDCSEVPDDPQATIRKAERVQRAALAPADPSPQDRRVAAEAAAMANRARQELVREKMEQQSEAASRHPSLDVFV